LVPSVLDAVVRLLIDLVLVRSGGATAGDVELLALRCEVRVLPRSRTRTVWRPGDRFVFAVLRRSMPRPGWRVLPVRPETLLRWHRELVRRGWTVAAVRRRPGRPPLAAESRDLVRRLATENPGWGYRRIRGALLTLGRDASATTSRSILRRPGVPPAPRRIGRGALGRRDQEAEAEEGERTMSVTVLMVRSPATPDCCPAAAPRTARVGPVEGWPPDG
jgi:putative transposase